MNPRSIPALAQKLLESLKDTRLRIDPSGGWAVDNRAPGQGRAIVFEGEDGSSASVPEFRNQDGLTRTVYYSRIRPKPQTMGELISIFVVPEASDPEPPP